MGKVLKVVASVAAIAVAFVPGVGTALSGAIMTSSLFGAVGGVATFASVAAASTIVGGVISMGVLSAVGIGTKALGLGPSPPKSSPANSDRLRASINPRAPRTIVFGRTAMATDVQYQEFTGADQEYLNMILVAASHKVQAIDEIWFDTDMAWSASGGVTTKFSGYLTVTTRAEGTPANAFTISGSSSWVSSTARMTGCAYLLLRYKLTGNSKKAESPFASKVSSRITIRGKGAPMYDPRLDSMAGGSGSHRADDQTTWAWVSDDVGRNPALQLLWYLLGWRIQNPATSTWKLAVGLGLPKERIDIASFIAAANICDEAVSLAAGGTEPRYRSDGVFSENDDPQLVFENLLASMNGVLRDAGGKIALELLVDDLATPVLDLTSDDVVGDFVWIQTPPIDQSFNVVRGRYTDPSDNSLYQMVDYPDVTLDSPDGIERATPFDMPLVQSASQAQRLAKQFLQRAQYPGTFAADFLATAWRCRVGSVVRLTFAALGFENKLFRVIEHTIRFDGICPMVLREENTAIYQWEEEEAPAVVAAAPISYDPINEPIVQAIEEAFSAAEAAQLAADDAQATADGKIATFYQPTAPTAAASSFGDRWIDTDDNHREYQRIDPVTYGGTSVTFAGVTIEHVWAVASDQRIGQALADAAGAQATADGKVVTFYSETEPVAEALGDLWYQPSSGYLKRWSGAAWLDVSNIGATAAQIASIGQALTDAANAQATADGKIRTFYQTSMPSGSIGDLWFDTDDGNKLYRHNGTTFVAAQDSAIGTAITAAAGAQATADGKVTTFLGESTPTAEGVGDLWYKSSTRLLSRWNGSSWVSASSLGAPSGTNVGGTSAATVESGANAANNGVNSDGTIKTDKVTTGAIVDNGVTTPWLVTANTVINFAAATKTLVLSTTVTKALASSLLEVHGQVPMYGADAVDIFILYEVYLSGVMQQQRSFTLSIDANNATYLPFAYEHYFSGLAAGTYDVRLYMQRFSANTCSTNGDYHMRVREFKK